jgi:rhodanese-related sulfurtransferase
MDAAAYFHAQGFENVKSMAGGIDAWSREVDQEVPRY